MSKSPPLDTGATFAGRAGDMLSESRRVRAVLVQRILRHSSVTVTTGIYGHLVAEDLRAAVALLPATPAPVPTSEPLRMVAGAPVSSREVPQWCPKLDTGKTPRRRPPNRKPRRGVTEWAPQVSNAIRVPSGNLTAFITDRRR